MKRLFILYIGILFGAFTVNAQVEKEVEVSKNYVPSLSTHQKRDYMPDVQDTVKMHPEIDYKIYPQSFTSELPQHRFKPAQLTYYEYAKQHPFYLKAGLGYPLNSVVDAYVSSERADVGYVMAYFNHKGEFSKKTVRNSSSLDRISNNSQQMLNRVGFDGGKYLGQYNLQGALVYESDVYERYPMARLPEDVYDPREVNFENFKLNIGFGDKFVDLRHFNFELHASADYFHDKSECYEKGLKFQQFTLNAGASIARRIGRRGAFNLGFDYDGYIGIKDLSAYRNNLLTARAGFEWASGKLINLEVGLKYVYDNLRDEQKSKLHHIFPEVHLSFNIGKKGLFVPFVELKGELENNSYHSLVKENPYFTEIPSLPQVRPLLNTENYDLRAGFAGHTRSCRLSYYANFNFRLQKNALYSYALSYIWVGHEQASREVMSVNAGLTYKPLSSLEMGLNGTWQHSRNHSQYCDPLPMIKANAFLRYSHRVFAIKVGCNFETKRTWSHSTNIEIPETRFTAPAFADLSLGMDFRIKQGYVLFIEGRNLANQDMYSYAFYKKYGAAFTVGVKINL